MEGSIASVLHHEFKIGGHEYGDIFVNLGGDSMGGDFPSARNNVVNLLLVS
jgi:hypothetical protein